MYDRRVNFKLPAIEWSEPIRTVEMLRRTGGVPIHLDGELRALTAREIEELNALGNHCADWSLVSVARGFSPQRIVGSHFIGRCILGAFDAADELPAGVFSSTVAWSVIGSNARVHRCPYLIRAVLDRGVTCIDARVEGPPAGQTTCFGCGTTITVGSQLGGRAIAPFPEIDPPTVELVLDAVTRDTAMPIYYPRYLAEYQSCLACAVSYLAPESTVNGARLQESWVGPRATIADAHLASVTVLSTAQEPTRVTGGARVQNSLLQWGVTVETGATLNAALMMEQSTAEHHATVTSAVIGPNSSIGGGEVCSSFLGPLVSAYHQSLLIGAFWPQGRGNVGYGANVGSNHTTRAPDQEIRPAEGTFFGLNCALTFPIDLVASPYCVVAASVMVAPQRVAMPFSLIGNLPAGMDPRDARNLLMPGWLLYANSYALMRNILKFGQRSSARRSSVDLDPFRDKIMAEVRSAHDRLAAASGREIYTADHIKGVGAAIVREGDRLAAIRAYALLLQFAELRAAVRGGAHELRPQLKDLAQQIIAAARRSRERDYARGQAVFGDYAMLHPPLDHDPTLAAIHSALGLDPRDLL